VKGRLAKARSDLIHVVVPHAQLKTLVEMISLVQYHDHDCSRFLIRIADKSDALQIERESRDVFFLCIWLSWIACRIASNACEKSAVSREIESAIGLQYAGRTRKSVVRLLNGCEVGYQQSLLLLD
jgi:hypothetical protein